MNKEKSLSFENTRRLFERYSKVHDKLTDILFDGLAESVKDATSQVNKAVYEMAEKQGLSLWDICFSFIPESCVTGPATYDRATGQVSAPGEIRLVPLAFEFEKGPGYWKAKYLRLKEKMQSVINEEEEEE